LAIEAIRAAPGRENLPIIALTSPDETTEDPVSRGASASLPKPVDLDDLLEVMGRLLDRAPAREARP